MAAVAIALGSNLEPARHMADAVRRLSNTAEIELIARSAVYATPSVGRDGSPDGQPDFHNAVVLARTALGPLALRSLLRGIEADMGRRRTSDKYAPRPIDLDIVFYDSVVLRTEAVTIPDPDALDLPHLTVPLAEVAPDWRPPGGTITAAEAAEGQHLAVVG